MIDKKNKMLAFGAIALSLCLGAQTIPPTRSLASDHIDSPVITHDRSSDLTDTFAFLDPNDNSKVVLIMSTQGFVVSGEHFGMAIFDSNIRYRFEIENTGDAKPDAFVDVTYSKGLGASRRRRRPSNCRTARNLPRRQPFQTRNIKRRRRLSRPTRQPALCFTAETPTTLFSLTIRARTG
jgi:hypothetical protein